jgi:hypothetical protein
MADWKPGRTKDVQVDLTNLAAVVGPYLTFTGGCESDPAAEAQVREDFRKYMEPIIAERIKERELQEAAQREEERESAEIRRRAKLRYGDF